LTLIIFNSIGANVLSQMAEFGKGDRHEVRVARGAKHMEIGSCQFAIILKRKGYFIRVASTRVNSVITLSLLHPIQHIPLRTWKFDREPVVRIGRSQKNDVVIASAVVSRHHIELWHSDEQWEAISFGSNGTYINGERINQVPIEDGMVIRLGSSGPRLRVQFDRLSEFKSISRQNTSDIIASQA
jgi:pSer/pThr/pTyr-binding forkhead associated (FHA) protein